MMIKRSVRIDASGSIHTQALREVTFHSRVHCIGRSTLFPNNKDFEGYWYTKEEITSFRKRDKKYIRTLITSPATSLTGDDDDSDEVSLVGLLSEKEHLQRVKRIREARTLVMEEQLSQEEKFFSDHANLESFQLDQEFISDCYSSSSRRSTESAYMRGLEVSYHVDNLWKDEEDKENADIDASHRSCSQRSCSQRSISISTSRPSLIARSVGSIKNSFARLKRVG